MKKDFLGFMAATKKSKKTRKEIIVYLICGVLTTVVNLAVYHVFYRLGAGVTISGIISVTAAKIFAYVSNKLLVFESHCENKKELGFEMGRFAIVRGLSGVVDVVLTTLLSKIILENFELAFLLGGCSFSFVVLRPGIAAKYITQPIVIILNYVLGKKYVFKGQSEEQEEEAAEKGKEVSPDVSEIVESESRPFHAILMLIQDYVQEMFGILYRFLFSSAEEEEDSDEAKPTIPDRLFAFLAFFRVLDLTDWVRSLFGKNEGDAYYNNEEDAYTVSLPGDGKSGFLSRRFSGFKRGHFSIVNAIAKVFGLLIVFAAILCLWRVSRGVYHNFTMDQGHVFRQAHMFESFGDVLSFATADRSGALFSALQIIYAKTCAKINYALLVTPAQY